MLRALGVPSALALGLLAGCGPNPRPAMVMVLAPDGNGNRKPTKVELRTMSDLTSLDGTLTKFVGGAAAVVPTEESSLTATSFGPDMDQSRYAAFVKDPGRPVRANYVVEHQKAAATDAGVDEDVLWPADFHTWNMVTTVYNFELSYRFYEKIFGEIDPVELKAMRILYWVDFRSQGGPPQYDNALFVPFLKSFAILPFAPVEPDQMAQRVPLAMNSGVIGHEMAHRVFNYRVLADSGLHPALNWSLPRAFNLLKSVEEGFADFLGFGVTCGERTGCRQNYVKESLPSLGDKRDFTRTDLCVDDKLLNAFENSTPNLWTDPNPTVGRMYDLGTIWAASLYQGAFSISGPGGVEAVQMALVAAYNDETPGKPGLRQLIGNALTPDVFTSAAVADAILSHITENGLKTKVCGEMLTRLGPTLTCNAGSGRACMPNCPGTAVQRACP